MNLIVKFRNLQTQIDELRARLDAMQGQQVAPEPVHIEAIVPIASSDILPPPLAKRRGRPPKVRTDDRR